MKVGDIVFVRGNSLISKLVRLFDRGRFSHVAVIMSNNGTHVLEAQYFTKSRITPFYFDDYEVVNLNLTEEERIKVSHIGISLVGKWYDYPQVLGYLFNKNLNNPNHYICSEIISIILTKLNKIDDYESVRNATPNELYRILKQKKN